MSSSSAPGRTRSLGASSGRRATPDLPPLIVIAGATATGKTALAVDLALGLPGSEVISADSRQVYRGMDIGTAKATLTERRGIPHHGLDLVEPDSPFTASDYRTAALAALAGIASRGGLAILAGGTGLYLRSVARGLPLEATGHDAALRVELESRLATDGLAALVAELRSRDPRSAGRLDLRNPRRVVRALERHAVSGSALPPEPVGYPAPSCWLGLAADPPSHRAAIEARVEAQFGAGLLEEAACLLARYPEDLAAFSAMGYREAFDVLAGRRDLASAKSGDAQRTWAYARRQGTWFRSEPGIRWLEAGEGAAAHARAALAPFLRSLGRDGYAGAP